ncbi:lipid-binding SYLF domain-containing protein [Salinisphaera dokdonensis]
MRQWMTALFVAVAMLSSTSALAANEQQQKLDDATTVVSQFVDIPENAIPPALLGKAYGIAVIPSVFKAGFVVGGRHGKGVLTVRTKDGSWSNPTFISLTGGSIGWQIGASSSDIILVFKTQRSIDKIASGQINLGADAAVAAGPVGRSAGASTNLGFDAEVYSYSRARGLFAGVSLEGGKISIDREANWLFYDKAGIDAYTILRDGDESKMPQAGQKFIYTLDRYMPASSDFDREAATEGTKMEDSGNANSNGYQSGDSARGQAVPYDGRSGVEVQQGNYDAADNNGNAGAGYDQGSSNDNSYDYNQGNQGNGASGQGGASNTQGSGSGDYGSGANSNY